jgi:hypothetical protein
MKKPLYYLDEYEKNRILEMHKTSTKKQYITENKKVLNEAFWLWALGITGVAAGAGYVWKNWGTIMGNVTEEKFLKLNTACDKPEVSSQKTYNTSQQHVSFAKEFRKAFDWGETYSFGIDVGTDNELVTSTLSSIKSMADYCKVRKEFKKLYGKDLGSEMNDEIDKNFDKIVMDALSGAIKKSVEDGMEIEGYSEDKVDNEIKPDDNKKPDDGNKPDDEEFKQSGGGEDENEVNFDDSNSVNWISCSSEFKFGCKDMEYTNEVKKIQRCLGLTPSGKFGKKTESELQSQFGKKTINDDEIALLCGDF